MGNETSQTESPTRCMAIDAIKLMAAAAVVWIHVSDCEESNLYLPLCRFAVPFFTCAAVYFVLQKAIAPSADSFGRYCLRRAQRLYIPFLVWAAFYLAVRVAKHYAVGQGSPITFTPAVLLNGTAHHLWFLPFISLISIAAFVLGRALHGVPERNLKRLGFLFVIGGIVVALAPDTVEIRAEEAPISYFADHALDTLPSAFFGVGVFCLVRSITPHSWLPKTLLLVAFICMTWEFLRGGHPVAPHIAGGALLFFATTQPNRPWMAPVGNWANLAFIIYLIHVLFVEALQVVQSRFGAPPSLPADLSVWALALIASALAARLMLRARVLRWACPQ
jgi:surface polysaccharide O-acyltransferase-like enzyme